ncbi:septal ring lytic transglycosylase RlpA family protein [Leptolyngbya cf. ectocarpi LEGE 11479]|uniref:Probable endolytic peptidoglycan transglycosylase RlpA n=1 Tax=Leptolyngbya cf. ectocarpi LEGE 11479 TaxID=1828722 RepID=A0A928WYK7_LEPEC|nr:septal ring lytic transglycosylase RlpA family protein [Leptolyngbya ectocarpi]MBE9065692.1 septal ring lytic transglycosylase RlpA family protein [Leptolyngbya cf. ectocarpi LEGE 11479]
MAVSSQSVSVMSNTKRQPVPSTDSAALKALLPGSFQLLEPLNLAAVAVSLETLFTLSLEPATDSSPPVSTLSVGAIPAVEVPKPSTNSPGQDARVANPREPVTATLQKVSPIPGRDNLSRCVEVEKPQDTARLDTLFQVLLRGTVIGDIRGTHGPEYVVQALQEMLVDEPFNPHDIAPVLGENNQPAIRLSQDILVSLVNEGSTQLAMNSESEWAAITWSDQLRQAMGVVPLDAGEIEIMLKGLHPSEQQLNGLASWYGPYFHGRLTANGEIFDQNTLTAAHKSLPFNTLLQVRNLKNDQTVVVRVNDRGPYVGKRSLDLSKAAAHCLGSEQTGVIPYEAVILEQPVTAALSVN